MNKKEEKTKKIQTGVHTMPDGRKVYIDVQGIEDTIFKLKQENTSLRIEKADLWRRYKELEIENSQLREISLDQDEEEVNSMYKEDPLEGYDRSKYRVDQNSFKHKGRRPAGVRQTPKYYKQRPQQRYRHRQNNQTHEADGNSVE